MEEKRFSFGDNWLSFLETMDEERVASAVLSLKEMLGTDSLYGRSFLDIGCGSGLFSLAAVRMGARVFSFDYDIQSVACALELRKKYGISTELWTIQQGSILDLDYIDKLPVFDIVYSWGVLHHTGDLKRAVVNASYRTAPGGAFFIAVYNNQGLLSFLWKKVKEVYCSGALGRFLVLTVFIPFLFMRSVLSGLFRKGNPFYQFANYRKNRGMSIYHDWIDWLGGYPFETASPQEMQDFMSALGFELKKSRLTSSWGCNEFVFIRKQ